MKTTPIPNFIPIGQDYDCGHGVTMRLFENADISDFQSLCLKTLDNGFSLFSSTELESNFHKSYKKDDLLLYIYYCSNENKLRIIADAFSSDYPTKKLDSPIKTQSKLWQLKNDHTYVSYGMCYIVQCADSSFFILDSGHHKQKDDHKQIHKILRENTNKDEKIVIAGWFFSHAHDDHIYQFVEYLKEYKNDTIIEKIFFNTPPLTHRDNESWGEDNKVYFRLFEETIKNCVIPTVKVHTGQKIFLRNLEIDILCTHEDIFPNSLSDYNNSSVVYLLTVDNCKILFPGDATTIEYNVITNRYSEKTLKCDFLQQSHHGLGGGSVEFYRMCNAEVIMFPTSQKRFDELFDKIEENRVSVEIAKECYISSNGTAEFELPYTLGTAKLI